jgi:hypothetical protein
MLTHEHQSLRQGLVGAWCPSLGASGLSLIDRSGRNAHGTLTNMAGQDNWRASGSGVALNLDATNDFAALPSNIRYLSSGAPFSLSWWERITANTNAYPARFRLNSATNTWLVIRSTDTTNGYAPLAFGEMVGSGRAVNTASIATVATSIGAWRHICLVSLAGPQSNTAANWQGYDQGASVAINSPAAVFGANTATLNQIGWDNVDNGPDCQMDDIRLYNRALTPPEIRLLASRRGIGLTPLPDRAAGLPRKLFVNDAGTWRDGDAYVNTGSEWRLGIPSVNDAGTWR